MGTTIRSIGITGALMLLLVACGDDAAEPKGKPEQKPTVQEPTVPPDVDPIVGEWSRITTCADRVAALTEAGMAKYAVASVVEDGLVQGVGDVSELENPKKPCLGAKPVEHRHFFTQYGEFGSLDQNGNQVDDGTYELPRPGVLVIGTDDGPVTFDYAITDGSLSFVPRQVPACASHGCFLAQWEVNVTYLGLPWKKVDSR